MSRMSKSAREHARGHHPLGRRAGERAQPLVDNTVARSAKPALGMTAVTGICET